MSYSRYCFILFLAIFFDAAFGQTTSVNHFDKVIISPYVQVTFVQGNEEKVVIEKSKVPNNKIHIEVNGETLRIYLDGAKEITKNKTVYEDGQEVKRSLYNGTNVVATVTYKTLNDLSIRGEENILLQSLVKCDDFNLKLYGETHVVFDEVSLGNLTTKIYGESTLEMKAGSVTHQRYTAYGESKINNLGIAGKTAKITAYGEAAFKLNVSDEIKITSFGNAKLKYMGDPIISKGLNIGGVEINKIN